MCGHTVPPAEVAEDRVLNVRRQLAKGDYDVKGRLGAAFDKLIEELVAESEPGKMVNNANGGSSENRTRILIVDDHAIVRQGLTRLVEAECDLTVCAEAENAAQALEAIDRRE